MFAEGRIPLWIVAVIAGLGALSVLGLFFYGAYAGLGSSMQFFLFQFTFQIFTIKNWFIYKGKIIKLTVGF